MIRSPLSRMLLVSLLAASPGFARASSPAWPPLLSAPTHRALSPPAPAGRVAPHVRPAAVSSLDGTWTEFGLLQQYGAGSWYDDSRDRLVMLGGSREEAWTLALAGPPLWTPAAAPVGVFGYGVPHNADWDAQHEVAYLYGFGSVEPGVLRYDPNSGATTPIATSGPAPYVLGPQVVFDPSGPRVLLLGGSVPDTFGVIHENPDVWALELSSPPHWNRMLLAPVSPLPPVIANVVLDPARHRLLALAVSDPDTPTHGADWALPLDGPLAWTRLSTSTPPSGVPTNTVVFDASSDRALALAGDGALYAFPGAGGNWSLLSPAGSGPSARSLASLAIDTHRNHLLVVGGQSPLLDDTHSDLWAYDLSGSAGWSTLVPDRARPPIRSAAADAFDASRSRLVVCGGADVNGFLLGDTWTLALTAEPVWSVLPTVGAPPSRRQFAGSAWDEAHDRMLVVGGMSSGGPYDLSPPDVWQLSFAEAPPRWSQVTPSGPGPSGSLFEDLVYDPIRDRFLYLFGADALNVHGEVWELRLQPTPTWRQLHPAGPAIPARAGAMAVYDATRDQIVVFGGSDDSSMLSDTWTLKLASGDGTWVPLPTAHAPSGRNLAVMKLDRTRDRLLLFGGYGITHQDSMRTEISWLDDTWSLPLSGSPDWRPLSPAGIAPPPRDRTNAAYDPLLDRLVLACGAPNGSNGTWSLDFTDAATATDIALVSSEVTTDHVSLTWAGAGPATDATVERRVGTEPWAMLGRVTADGEGRIAFTDRNVTPGEVFEYRIAVTTGGTTHYFGATSVQIPPPAALLALSATSGASGASLRFQLPSAAPATLALFDVSGRRVWSRPVGAMGTGAHEIALEPTALHPALYFAKLEQAGRVRTAHVVVLR